MLKIDDNLLQQIGLGGLPVEEKRNLLNHIYETLEMRVGMRLADQMTNEQLDEFEQYFEAKDDAGAFKWLESNFPNYKDIVNEEFEKLRNEVSQNAPHILNAAQQQQMAAGTSQAASLPQSAPTQPAQAQFAPQQLPQNQFSPQQPQQYVQSQPYSDQSQPNAVQLATPAHQPYQPAFATAPAADYSMQAQQTSPQTYGPAPTPLEPQYNTSPAPQPPMPPQPPAASDQQMAYAQPAQPQPVFSQPSQLPQDWQQQGPTPAPQAQSIAQPQPDQYAQPSTPAPAATWQQPQNSYQPAPNPQPDQQPPAGFPSQQP